METSQAQPNPDIVMMPIPRAMLEHISISGVVYQEIVQRTVTAAVAEGLQQAAATIETQREALAEAEKMNQQQSTKLREAMEVIGEQSRRIKLLEGTPSVVEPVPPAPPVVPVTPIALAPIITKTVLSFVAGFCITLGRLPPSATVDAAARELIVMGRDMGFNTVRFFRNQGEVAADLKRTDDDLRNLYAFARKQGLTVVADTINQAAFDMDDAELKTHLAGLKTLGAPLFIFDDANQYREAKTADGKLKYPTGTLERLVKRVRDLQPNIPIMASLTAGAVIKDYEPLFDFTEAQTFGSTANLDNFLDRGFDAYVLDGRASASQDYLRRAHDIILKDMPKAIFWYTSWDETTDWHNMDDKTPLIEKTVKALKEKWMAQPLPVKA